MKIAQSFAGYTLGEADVLRRAVSKKDSSMLESLENDFINKSISKGYSKEIAKDIYDLIYKFANYGFNRSHSVAYAMLSYQMAYFKANYFPVFMANVLNNTIGSSQMINYIKYAKERGVITVKPDINLSDVKFVLSKKGLVMPFNAITSIGNIVASQIVEERKLRGAFVSYENFIERTSFLSESVKKALVYSGALDSFGKSKKYMAGDDNTKIVELEHDITAAFDKLVAKKIFSEYDFQTLKDKEKEYLGINLEYNIFNGIDDIIKKYKPISLSNVKLNSEARLVVAIFEYKEITTKKNDKMLVGHFEDLSSNKRFVIFPNTYSTLDKPIKKDSLYYVLGKLEMDNKNEETFNVLKIALIK